MNYAANITPIFLNPELENRICISRAVKVDSLIFISGTLSVDAAGEVVGAGCMKTQLEQVYRLLGETLEKCGSDASRVIKETIFVTDMVQFLAELDARKTFYLGGVPPAATGVEVRRLALAEALVEIEVVAAT